MRLFLIALTVVFAAWLPRVPVEGSEVPYSPTATIQAGQAVLAMAPGRYGSIQHVRTPLPPKAVALTFDDGPSLLYNRRVLDILDERGIKATFFFVGQYVKAHPEQVREVVRRGHNVGSHSWSHPAYLRHWGREAQITEVRRSYAALEAALADAPPEERARIQPMFRFPGLGEGAFMADWLNQRGIIVVSAEAGTNDWRGYSAGSITRSTLNAMESNRGGVLILHETRPQMIQALPGLLDELTARGFTFVQITAGPEGRERALTAEDAVLTLR